MWLRDDELRVGLGCMRLSTEEPRDEARAVATIEAALAAGVTLLDTAHAYALHEEDRGHNERLIARAIAQSRVADVARRVRIVTKGGMRRPEGRWHVDGRARTIAQDCAASLAALDGLPIDLYLLHAPDPDVDFAVSVRALAVLLDKHVATGLVRAVGLSNVTRAQLDLALTMLPVAAVEAQLSWFDASALEVGVLSRCVERGIPFLAHRPLGGTKKQRTLARDKVLAPIAQKRATTTASIALAAVLDLDAHIVALAGATTPAHAGALADVARVRLDDDDRAQLATKLDRARVRGPRAPRTLMSASDGEVVMLMGLQGAGKTDALSTWLARGYERANRDELGGTMRSLHKHLDARLATGARRVVLDNTYTTRKVRREAIETAWRHDVPVRGVWHETSLVDAQVNVILRMLAAHGRLLMPDEISALGGGPNELPPHAQHRTLAKLERPTLDEGYAQLDVVTFARRAAPSHLGAATFIALEALARASDDVTNTSASATTSASAPTPTLVFAWRPSPLRSARSDVPAHFAYAECTHGAGPPVCWCRPPLPGLLLAFAHAHGVDPARSTLVGTTPTHRALAAAVGARFVDGAS